MKRLVCASILAITLLTGCSADNINSAVNTIGSEAGVDINLNLKQEDVDKVTDKLDKVKDKAQNIAEDEEVRDALGNLVDALENASKESNDGSTETNFEP